MKLCFFVCLACAWSPTPPQRPPPFLQATAGDHLSGSKLRNLHYMKLLWITHGVVSSLLSHRKVNLVTARQQYSQYSRSQFSCSVSLSHLISLGKIPASVTVFIFCRSFRSLLGCGLFVFLLNFCRSPYLPFRNKRGVISIPPNACCSSEIFTKRGCAGPDMLGMFQQHFP